MMTETERKFAEAGAAIGAFLYTPWHWERPNPLGMFIGSVIGQALAHSLEQI